MILDFQKDKLAVLNLYPEIVLDGRRLEHLMSQVEVKVFTCNYLVMVAKVMMD